MWIAHDASLHLHRPQAGQVRRAFGRCASLYREAVRLPGIRVAGIDCHIGSQITEIAPFLDALASCSGCWISSRRKASRSIDLGSGWRLGISLPGRGSAARATRVRIDARLLQAAGGSPAAGPAASPAAPWSAMPGVLLTRVEYLKRGAERDFAIVDAGHERPHTPGAVRGLARHPAGPALAPSPGPALRHRRPDMRERGLLGHEP